MRRYVNQLLTPCNILARLSGAEAITEREVDECEALFVDAKRSAQTLESAEGFLK